MKHSDEDEFEKLIERLEKRGLAFTISREVLVTRGTDRLGNGSWGKVDYLVNHLGYRLVWR